MADRKLESGNLLDIMQNVGNDGKYLKAIATTLSTSDSLFTNMYFVPSSDKKDHTYYRQEGEFIVQDITLDEGVPISDTAHVPETEPLSNLATSACIYTRESEIGSGIDSKQYLASRSEQAIQAIKKKYSLRHFYGDGHKCTIGLANRKWYNNIKEEDSMVIDAGGIGNDLTSIWIMHIGKNSLYNIYNQAVPGAFRMEYNDEVHKNTMAMAGIQRKTITFILGYGICIPNPLSICRIANISLKDVQDVKKVPLFNLIVQGLNKIESSTTPTGKRIILCRPEISGSLRLQGLLTNVNSQFMQPSTNQFGKHFSGINVLDTPVVSCAEISNKEQRVV